MKLLIINSVCGIRSTGRICTQIAREYIEKGHEVRIAYGRETIPDEYKPYAVRIGTQSDVRISALKARLMDNDGFNSATATKAFLKWADTYDPDMVWLHNLHGYYINVDQLFRWIKSRPHMQVNWTLHDCWAFTGHCSHFVSAKCEKWKTGCHTCPKKKAYPQSLLLDNSKVNYQKKKALFTGVSNMTIITPSQWLAGLAKESFLKKYPIVVRNNKIDLSVFRPTPGNFRSEHNLEDKKIVLGVASAWGKSKGLYDFLALSQRLDERYSIVLVGLNGKQMSLMKPNMLGICKTNNVQELAQIYTAADVFVNPTHCDTYPTVNLEARACGTPVITYNVGGSPESAGYEHILEENDIDGLINTIHAICFPNEP